MKKRVVSVLLALSMLLPTVNVVTFADEGEVAQNTEQTTILTEVAETEYQDGGYEEEYEVAVTALTGDETDLSATLQSGAVEITADGEYCISNVSTSNAITVKGGVSAELTITDVTITQPSDVAPIYVEDNASLVLHISGTNTLTAAKYYAGIAVINTATLTIDGDGVLNATGGQHGAGIGTNKTNNTNAKSGKITINGGTINATGTGQKGVGIGTGNYTTAEGGEIEINGGVVTATSSGNQAAAIGAGYKKNGKITINGGYVKANSSITWSIGPGKSTSDAVENIYINGGSVDATFRSNEDDKIQDKDGNTLVKREITMPDGFENTEVTVNDWKSVTDASGKLYVYVTEATTSYVVECGGKQYYTDDIVNSPTLTEATGTTCTCDNTNASIALDISDEIRVNKIVGQTKSQLSVIFTQDENCTSKIHNPTCTYTLTGTDDVALSSDIAEISGGYIIAKYNNGTNTVRVKVTATLNGSTFTDTKDISIIGDDTSKFNLSSGSITITNGSTANTFKVTVGTDEYTVSADSEIRIYQSGKTTTNTIDIAQGVTNPVIVLDNLNVVSDSSLKNILTIGDGVELTLKLKGKNNIESQSIQLAAIKGISGSSKLIIDDYGDDDGEVTFKSKTGAGIGTIAELTVNGGDIYAYGGNGGAGIGGNKDGSGFNVTINGGNVYAYGDSESGSNAAGIGGGTGSATGTSGQGGNVIINGGYVKAVGNGSGYGIGNGGNKTAHGNIRINGGSVDATLGTVPNNDPNFDVFTSSGSPNKKYNQYLVETTIEGVTDKQDIEYSVTSDSYSGDEVKIKTHTDENGKLYLYTNAGKQWVRAYKDGITYYRYSKVEAMYENTFVCVKNIDVSITEFKISGQTQNSTIDNENKTISVTVPYNIMLDKNVTPNVKFNGSFADEEIEFNGSTTGTYTITGDDKTVKEYTVTLNLENAPTEQTQDVYDISKGTVHITGSDVRYGGVYYKPNANGYVVTGSTTENNVTFDQSDDASLPPVTFKNLDIQLNNSAAPVKCYWNTEVTVSGTCNLTSALGNGIQVENQYLNSPKLTVKSTSDKPLENMLTVTGGVNMSAVNIGMGATLEITGVPTVLTSQTTTAVMANGNFVTDSKTYMKLVENGLSTVKSADGTSLYQLKGTLKGTTANKTTCVYNDTDYYIGADRVLYIMLPNNTYSMLVKYNDDNYIGDVTVNSAVAEVDLYSTYVEKVEYDSTTRNHNGGDVTFTFEGKSLDNNVKIKLVSRETPPLVLEKVVTKDADTGKYTATVTLPENTSTEKQVIYDVYYVIKGKDTQLENKLIVDFDRGIGRITAFGIDGQVGQTSIYEDDKIVTVYMPYDHEYQQYYRASTLDIIGKSVDPIKDKNVEFYTDIAGYRRKNYTVTAKDNTTKVEYTVKIYKQKTPEVTALRATNPTTGEVSTVTVNIIGKSLNNLKYAENEKNRKIYIYSDDGLDPVEATYSLTDGNDVYTAELVIPENESDTADKIYHLKAKIGDTEQSVGDTQIRVPRKERGLVGIEELVIENQVGDTQVSGEAGKNITVIMPFDADITNLYPNITLEDMYATYSPTGEQDFTSDVVYTVTAENRVTTKDYTVHVEKQAPPVAKSITFTNPSDNSGGRVQVTVNGDNLENAENSLNNTYIRVKATLKSGDTEDSGISQATAKRDENGNYVATLVVPKNYNTEIPREYTLSVSVCGEWQDLTGNVVLTVPRRLRDSKTLTDFVLMEEQGEIIKDGNKWYIYVPYNTNLNNLTPTVHHTGVSYTPTEAQDFDTAKEYTIIAEDNTRNAYQINVLRDDIAKVTNVSVNKKPATYKDTKGFTIDIKGNFIPYLRENVAMDEVVVTAVPENGGSNVPITLTYDGYGGHATGSFVLPENNDTENDKIYNLIITVNGTEQQIGSVGEIKIPRRKTRAITQFNIENQVGETVIDNTKNEIVVTMPYDTDIKKLTPTVKIDGDAYSPMGEQNFKNATKSLVYTVSAADDTDRKYTVKIQRDGAPSLTGVEFVSPLTYKAGSIDVKLDGIFFDTAKVVATDGSGNKVDGSVTVTTDKTATVTLNIPVNDSQQAVEYTLSFELDGFSTEYTGDKTITVPRRTTRQISSFALLGEQDGIPVQEGETVIDGTDIYVKSPYVCDLSSVMPQITFDADMISPSDSLSQNFDDMSNPVKYTLSSADDTDVVYTIHVEKIGEDPYLNTLTVEDQYRDTEYKDNEVKLVLKRSANLKEVEPLLDYCGSDYEPKGIQDFSDSVKNPLVYTIKNKYGVEKQYFVTITRKKSSSSKNDDVTPTPTPTVSPSPEPSEEPIATETPVPEVNKPYINGYEENGRKYFAPDSTITRAEIAKILSVLDEKFDESKEYTSKFDDVASDAWYKNYVNFAVKRNYISGDENGLCRPEDMISRAEFASMIARYVGVEPYIGDDKFTDIARFDWCRSEINALAELGIVSGYTDGAFMPDDRLTRAEAVAIINRAIGREITAELLNELVCPFDDVKKSHWAYADIIMASCEY